MPSTGGWLGRRGVPDGRAGDPGGQERAAGQAQDWAGGRREIPGGDKRGTGVRRVGDIGCVFGWRGGSRWDAVRDRGVRMGSWGHARVGIWRTSGPGSPGE